MGDDEDAPIATLDSGDSRRESIRDHLEGEVYTNKRSEFVLPALALCLIAIPACLAAVGIHPVDGSGRTWSLVSLCLLALGGGLYYWEPGTPGQKDRPNPEIYPPDQAETAWPWTFPPARSLTDREEFSELDTRDIDILLTEYEQIAEEVRYRDQLLNRTTYFALAIVGVLATALATTPSKEFLPGILLLTAITTLLFAIATMKYKDARDIHWKRQRDLERLVPEFRGRLTVFHSNRSPKRRFLDRWASLSSFMISLLLALCLLATGAYVYLVGVRGLVL